MTRQLVHSPSSWFRPPAPPRRCASRRRQRKSRETAASSVTQTQNGFTELLWATRSTIECQIHTDASSVLLTYAEHLRRAELKLSCMTAVDEHGPHHIRGRDGLNILHQWQFNFLTTTKTTEWHISGNILLIVKVFTLKQYLHHIQKIFQVWRGLLRLKSNHKKDPQA